MATVTEEYREETEQDGKKTATVQYLVTGAASSAEALGANGIPKSYQAYNQFNPFLLCTKRSAKPYTGKVNTTCYMVSVEYSIKSSGGQQQFNNPLNIPTRFVDSFSSSNEQFDLDIDGKPITNSARDRFNQTFSKDIGIYRFSAIKWFDASNIASLRNKCKEYNNVINSDVWLGYPAKTLKCFGGNIMGEYYSAGNSILELKFDFEYREDGWGLRVLDEGYKIYNVNYNVSATEDRNKFKYIPENPEGNLVKLNGKGNKFGYVGTLGEGPLLNAEIESTSDAVFLKFKIYKEKSFGSLGL